MVLDERNNFLRERKKMKEYWHEADKPILSEEEQLEIARGEDIVEKRHLAKRADLCLEAAELLARDPDMVVRMELANRTCYESIWQELKKDRTKRVREWARFNPFFGRKV